MLLEPQEIQPQKSMVKPPAVSGRTHSGIHLVPAESAMAGTHRFEFTGSGAEYFRIWVVNLLLTILTGGIYSAWAKVRRLQYFYRNTRVAGAIFDYHGNPTSILKGRLLALTLLLAYKISSGISLAATLVIASLLTAIMPWLLARSFRFKMVNSSYRGLRFGFGGTVAGAYRTLSLFPLILAVTAFFAWSIATSFSKNSGLGVALLSGILPLFVVMGTIPAAHFYLKRYQHDNAYFGQTPFFFHAQIRDFFKIYGKAIGFFFMGTISVAIFGYMTGRIFSWLMLSMFGWLFTILYGLLSAYAFYLFVRPYLESRIQNLVWNCTEVGGHQFQSAASARKLMWIHASNLFFITLSLGLYKPFATIRLIKYRVESMSLISEDSLEEFLADQAGGNVGALGEEAGDFFDIDISL